jgi:hypothetical protein
MHFEAAVKERKCRLDEIDGQVKAALSEHATKASGLQESSLEVSWSLESLEAESRECSGS